jgi:kynurenine formamidase
MAKAAARTVPTEEEVLGWFEKYNNWGRWGPQDEFGTMNFLTPEKRLKALQVPREGLAMSCQRPIEFLPSTDYDGTTATAAKRFSYPYRKPPKPAGFNTGSFRKGDDSLWIEAHSGARTHLDSPAHYHWKPDQLYNGFPVELAAPIPEYLRARARAKGEAVSMEESKLGIDVLADGVVGRGVLLDIARLRHQDWLDSGEAIFPEDLEAAEKAAGVRVEEGDIVVVRTGYTLRRIKSPIGFGPGTGGHGGIHQWPGCHAACIPWFYERRVSMLASDVPSDVSPSGYSKLVLPVHMLGLGAMGFWLLEGCDLEGLTAACQQRERWEFLFTFAPWKAKGFTGMPVNPTAVL